MVLDLLELGAHPLDPMQGGGVGDLADREQRRLDRVTRPRPVSATSFIESSTRAERSASDWNRSSFDEINDRIVWSRESSEMMRSCSGRMSLPEARQISAAISRIRSVACSSSARRPSSSCPSIDLRSDAEMRCSLLVISGSSSWCSSRLNTVRRGVPDCSSMTSLAIWGRRGAVGWSIGQEMGRLTHLKRVPLGCTGPEAWEDAQCRPVAWWGSTSAPVLCRGLRANPILGLPNVPRPGWPRCRRRVAQLGRAPVSKTGGWGFKSLRACKGKAMNRQMKRMQERAERQQKRGGGERSTAPRRRLAVRRPPRGASAPAPASS